MMRTKHLFTLLLIFLSQLGYSQIGGEHSFQFLSLPVSSRLTGLGGTSISVVDNDVALAYQNPALLSDKTNGVLSVNYDFHFAGIGNGYFAYGKSLPKWGLNAHAGINFITYGEFDRADVYGNRNGTFTGNEVALIAGASKSITDKFTAGANVRLITGTLESYNAFGFAFDLGGRYITNAGTVVAFSVQNLGTTLSDYGIEKNRLPINIQLGLSKRLKHIPFRYTITAHNLQTWQIRYTGGDGPQIIGGEVQARNPLQDGIDNIFSHLIISGEFLLGKKESFKLRLGYNHLRRKELSVADYRSLAGFSTGFGISIKGFRLDYGVGYHHLAGATNHLSISTTLGRIEDKIKL